jgi:hypothetical protein
MRNGHPRDAQRARVYRAELPLPPSPLPGLDACARFADRIVGTLWWHVRFPHLTLDRLPRLRPGNGARTAFFSETDDGDTTITLPRRYRTKGVVVHELAHWALHDQPDLPSHGATFARLMLDTTEEFCGAERAGALAEAYGWDERLGLGRGRAVTLRVSGDESEVRGVLERTERRGSVLVVVDGDETRRVPVERVWFVQGAR